MGGRGGAVVDAEASAQRRERRVAARGGERSESESMTRNRLAAQTRRRRSTKAEHRAFYDELVAIVTEIEPCTVRQVYYQAVVRNIIEKTEREYDRVQVALVKLREAGEIPWEHIVDSTRWVRKLDSWDDPAAAAEEAARVYRKSVWREAEVVPEIWLEKDALAGVVFDVTSEWDVGLYTARGYASLPFLYTSAGTIVARWKQHRKTTAIFHLGDFDPSGRDAARAIRERLFAFCGPYGGAFSFTELAVTPEQIETLDLPLRPTKKGDSRARAFVEKYGDGGSVELDAIHPDRLRALVSTAIEQHMPRQQLEVLRVVEAEERKHFATWAKAARGAA